MQNIELCVKRGAKRSKYAMVTYMKFIRTSTPDPKPMPLKPTSNCNPSLSSSIDSLIQEIGKQSSEYLQVLLAALQLEANKRGHMPSDPQSNPYSPTPTSDGSGSTPQDKLPNGNPPNNNPPNLPKSKDSILDQDKLRETIAKANENLVENLTSHGLLRTQTPMISQFSGMT